MVINRTSLKDLIGRYTNDILYDCHSVEARINRSHARVYLQKKGKKSLPFIADEMESQFSSENINYELLMAYAMLICGIIKDYKLPAPPYDSNVKYGVQNPALWIEYCRNIAISKGKTRKLTIVPTEWYIFAKNDFTYRSLFQRFTGDAIVNARCADDKERELWKCDYEFVCEILENKASWVFDFLVYKRVLGGEIRNCKLSLSKIRIKRLRYL